MLEKNALGSCDSLDLAKIECANNNELTKIMGESIELLISL